MDNNNNPSLGPGDGAAPDAGFGEFSTHGPAPEMDPADYLADMDDLTMTEAQKVELLETLWSIMRSFVEMGVDVANTDPCGQIFEDFVRASAGGVTSHRSKAVSAPRAATTIRRRMPQHEGD